jgi:hypothetical protein
MFALERTAQRSRDSQKLLGRTPQAKPECTDDSWHVCRVDCIQIVVFVTLRVIDATRV